MSRELQRVVLLLASSDLSDKELHDACARIETLHPGGLGQAVLALRRTASRVAESEDSFARDFNLSARQRARREEQFVERVERLLLRDGDVSLSQAVERFIDHLRESVDRSEKEIPSYNKIAFDKWLERLRKILPDYVILEKAAKVGEFYSQNEKRPWALKRE